MGVSGDWGRLGFSGGLGVSGGWGRWGLAVAGGRWLGEVGG